MNRLCLALLSLALGLASTETASNGPRLLAWSLSLKPANRVAGFQVLPASSGSRQLP